MTTAMMTADELATELRLKPHTVREWARQGLIPAMRISPKVLRFDLNEVIQALRQKTATQPQTATA